MNIRDSGIKSLYVVRTNGICLNAIHTQFKGNRTYCWLRQWGSSCDSSLLLHKRRGCCDIHEGQSEPSARQPAIQTFCYVLWAIGKYGSRNSSIGIKTSCTAGVRLPVEARNFYLFHNVQTGSGAHNTPLFRCVLGLFSRM
jgi:hypothetical protein